MDLKDLEINEKIVGVDRGYIKITAERINEEIAVICTIDPQTGKEVMRTHVNVETGYTALEDIDTNFWNIYINNERFEGYPFRLKCLLDINEREGKNNSMKGDFENRIINIEVR